MLTRAWRLFVWSLAAVGLLALLGGALLLSGGISARDRPGALETALARRARSLAIGRESRSRANPVPITADAVASGMRHFADHCAVCHGNDGSGDTEMGRGLYPRSPDMRAPATQSLSDGELFYIIEHGVRLTGMPAWGTGTPDSEQASWRLVHFIRHLPALTPAELAAMEHLNPKGPDEQIDADAFLRGETPSPSTREHSPAHRGGRHD